MAANRPQKAASLMGAPIRDAVDGYLAGGLSRFHMPGHKGVAAGFLGDALRYDITEVAGADSLYEASGAIAACEERYRRLYGSAGALLSAGGSTLCIQTMLALAARPGSKILCGRGVHTAALNAMTLLDLRPEWIYPELDPATGLALPVEPRQVEEALAAHPDGACVYLTSPDYYGIRCDVEAIALSCRRHGIPLLVDNAHGAHLKFLEPSAHPIDLGADLCCDSLHKTLPVITGGAVLHIGNPAYLPLAKARMSLFGSTSPSYLILQSMDEALDDLEREAAADVRRVSAEIRELEALARERGFLLPAGKGEPLRLTLGFGPLGYRGSDFRAHLLRHRIEPEYCSDNFCVLLAGKGNSQEDFRRLREAIASAEKRDPRRPVDPARLPRLKRILPLREAAFAPQERVGTDLAVGRVAGCGVAPCPPGIPIVAAGELVTEELGDLLERAGVFELSVIK